MLLIVIVPIPYCSVVRHHTTKKKKTKEKENSNYYPSLTIANCIIVFL